MIGLVVNSSILFRLQKQFLLELAIFKPIPIDDLHITLAILPTANSLDVEEAMQDVKTFEPTFTVTRLEILSGIQEFDYLAFKLKPDSHFKELKYLLENTINAIIRPDFIPHISIMKFPKGNFDTIKSEMDEIKIPAINISPTGVGLWNSNQKLAKEIRV